VTNWQALEYYLKTSQAANVRGGVNENTRH
jgi:hypothetical protein